MLTYYKQLIAATMKRIEFWGLHVASCLLIQHKVIESKEFND